MGAFEDFTNRLAAWAEGQPAVQAAVLAGSHARGAARPDSDVDIVLLVDRPSAFLENRQWVETFGAPTRMQVEDYGKVTSLRAWYAGGLEVEFGLAAPGWAALPLDDGTRRVVEDGLVVLFERGEIMSSRLAGLAAARQMFDLLAGAVRSFANPQQAEHDRRWFKNADYRSWGLRAADFAQVTRPNRAGVKRLSKGARLELARRLVETGYAEDSYLANWALELSLGELGPQDFETLSQHVERFHGWGACDSFCTAVLQPLLLRYPHETLSLLQGWNRSPNLWQRRASVVAFVRKVGASGQFTAPALALCENLLWDAEDLVQKGVDWALKDLLRGDRERVLAYIKDLRRRGAPSTITLYAIRELKGEARQAVLAIHKEKP